MSVYARDYTTVSLVREPAETFRTRAELDARIADLEAGMKAAARDLEFEKAAAMRDELKRLRAHDLGLAGSVP